MSSNRITWSTYYFRHVCASDVERLLLLARRHWSGCEVAYKGEEFKFEIRDEIFEWRQGVEDDEGSGGKSVQEEGLQANLVKSVGVGLADNRKPAEDCTIAKWRNSEVDIHLTNNGK